MDSSAAIVVIVSPTRLRYKEIEGMSSKLVAALATPIRPSRNHCGALEVRARQLGWRADWFLGFGQ